MSLIFSLIVGAANLAPVVLVAPVEIQAAQAVNSSVNQTEGSDQ